MTSSILKKMVMKEMNLLLIIAVLLVVATKSPAQKAVADGNSVLPPQCAGTNTRYIIDPIPLPDAYTPDTTIHITIACDLGCTNSYRVLYNTHPGRFTISGADMDKMPYTDIETIISLQPGAYQSRSGTPIHFRGSR